MKNIPALFFQAVTVLVGIGVLALMLWEPHLEGRNVGATPFEIYFNDPFLAYAYVGSVPFFIALYQVFALLGYVGRNGVLPPAAAHAIRAIKYCMVFLAGLIAAPLGYLVVVRPEDDIAGGVAMGLLLILVSLICAAAAAVFERTARGRVQS